MRNFDRYYDPPDDPPTFIKLRESRHRAGKDHKCDYCGGTIKKGTRYDKVVGIDDDGKFMSAHYHDSRGYCLGDPND